MITTLAFVPAGSVAAMPNASLAPIADIAGNDTVTVVGVGVLAHPALLDVAAFQVFGSAHSARMNVPSAFCISSEYVAGAAPLMA